MVEHVDNMVVFDAVVQVIEPEQRRDGRPDEELSTQGEVRTNVDSGSLLVHRFPRHATVPRSRFLISC